MLNKVTLYYHTLKYLKPIQIYGRVFSIFKHKLNRKISAPSDIVTQFKPNTNFITHEPWNTRECLINGEFTFLNESKQLSFPPEWNPEVGLLWKFNLHYFHYLFLLDKDTKRLIIYDWIDNNPIGVGASWHPYVISLRLINWIRENIDDEKIIKSLYEQTSFLYHNLEIYHPANHLLENAKALMFAGSYFSDSGDSKKWIEKGKSIFYKELPKQVLEDGSYFELTSMYHAKILEGLLDLYNISADDEFNQFLKKFINKMMVFLSASTHPDGNISLLNDSTQEIVPKTNKIINYARRLGFNIEPLSHSAIHTFSHSGIYVYNSEKVYFIIKAGKVGPDEIPAHAHADIFSYELSIMGEQFVVDSGVYEYVSGEMREYCRSTKAHNTVEVDNTNQCVVWGAHRVARRFEPQNIKFYKSEASVFFEGEFGGYQHLIGDNLVHKRIIEIDKKVNSIYIHDLIEGKGNHVGFSYIHLHPAVNLSTKDGLIYMEKNKKSVQLEINGKYTIEEGWYCSQFGLKIKNRIIKIEVPINDKIFYKYIIK